MSTATQELNIDQLLLQAQSADQVQRNNGMIAISSLAENNLSSFLIEMGKRLSDETKDSKIRVLSAILIKNSLLHTEKYRQKWKTEISKEEKDKIKLLVLSTLASSKKEIRTIASTVISSISKIDTPITETWPELLPSLTNNAFNEDINMKLSAIEALGYVCEELNLKSIDSSNVDKIMNALIQNLIKGENNKDVILQLLKALYYAIRLAQKNFEKKNERSIIMNAIFQIGGKYQEDEDVIEKIAMLFIEMLSNSSYYDYIEDFFLQIMKFSFTIFEKYKESNEKLALFGLEIICCIGEEEVSRNNNEIISLSKMENGTYIVDKKNKRYFTKISNELQNLIEKNVRLSSEDEDEDVWNISNACLTILNLMVQILDSNEINKFYENLAKELKNNFINLNNNNLPQNDPNNIAILNNRAKIWLLLGSCITKVNRMEISKILNLNLGILFLDIKQNISLPLKKSASYVILRCTKEMPKIFDSNRLGKIIELLVSEIKTCNDSIYMANLCHSLQNIIKCYGDLETNKSSSNLSPFFEIILDNLFIGAEQDIKNYKAQTKTTFNRFMTIGTLIENSSHDKQNQISLIIQRFLVEIEKTHNNMKVMIGAGIDKETIFQIQDYYYTLLQKLFNKYKSKIDINFADKIWILTESLFKFRQTVFDEANLAMAALARNMGKNFLPIFKLYYPYIEFSILSFNNNALCKSGLLSLMHCMNSVESNIGKTKEIIDTLIKVCISDEVARANKPIAINIIGNAAIFDGASFSPYLKNVMELLFSAAKLGFNLGNNIDEDLVEFVKNLRYQLIETFTCFELAFNPNEKNEINILTPFIKDIFEFLKFCINDTKIQSIEILKSILSLINDLFGIYGMQFKELCNEVFVSDFIKLIQGYFINKKIDPDIEQNIEILKSFFIHKN